MLDRALVFKMRQDKKTFQEIGNILGVSRQRIHQILPGKLHKEKIVYNKICIWGGEAFETTNENRKICSKKDCNRSLLGVRIECARCGKTKLIEQKIYSSQGAKYCSRECVKKYPNAEARYAAQKARIRERYANDKEYRERYRETRNAYFRKRYHENIEKMRAYRKKIYAQKRSKQKQSDER